MDTNAMRCEWETMVLAALPEGWRIAFGETLCNELRSALTAARLIETYQVVEVKEKYGELCWWDNDETDTTSPIIDKYEAKSRVTCVRCGGRATRLTYGYVLPFCEDCLRNEDDYLLETSVPIESEDDEGEGI